MMDAMDALLTVFESKAGIVAVVGAFLFVQWRARVQIDELRSQVDSLYTQVSELRSGLHYVSREEGEAIVIEMREAHRKLLSRIEGVNQKQGGPYR